MANLSFFTFRPKIMKRSLPLSGDEIQFEKLLKLKSQFRKNKNKFGLFDSGGKTVSSVEKFSEKLGSSSKIKNKNKLKFTKVAQNELLGLRFSEKMNNYFVLKVCLSSFAHF